MLLPKDTDYYQLRRFFCGFLAIAPAVAFAQEVDDSDVFEMSPFEVTTENDDRYYASNAISGSRLDVRIQDLPLTIEVLTSEFVEDTGATDLRETLRYSAGIVLQSQNDAFGGGFDNFGGVNNPEGATGDKSQSSFKIRGFVTQNTLRDGFRRQHATDTINIDRIEVVRGPSAILYGVGNFGGVVNYLPKRPLEFFQTDLNALVGSNSQLRGTLDTTGPLPWGFSYRLTAAYEDRDDWTEIKNYNSNFVSPVLQWDWKNTKIVLDFEYGESEENGIGFQSVRAPTLVGIPITQADRLETFGFLEFEGTDPRTFRWSGPDTFLTNDSWNANIKLEQKITDGIFFLVGYNKSNVEFDYRDIFGGIQTFSNPDLVSDQIKPLLNTIQAVQIIDGSASDVRIPVENAVLEYQFNGAQEKIDWDQVRAEVNLTGRYFENSKWLNSEHNLMLGYSWENRQFDAIILGVDASAGYYYKDPTDSNPILFDSPTDGSEVTPLTERSRNGFIAENEAMYAVYSARFLEDKLFFVAGVREDTTTNKDGYTETTTLRGINRTERESTTVRKQTTQFGISYEVLDGLSVYALRSGGVEPNFDGQIDGAGRALDSSEAESKEIGIKVDLFDSMVSATFSVFKIERSGVPFSYWWAPAPVRGNFKPNEDIVYRMQEWNLDNNPDNPYLMQAAAEWEAAKASGAVFNADNVGPDGVGGDGRNYLYLNASTPEGAAYLDAVFAALQAEFDLPRDQRTDNDPWPGWLYEGVGDGDQVINTAAQDWSSGGGDDVSYYQSIDDESEGFEVQLIFTPNDNFQLILNYSHVERTVTAPGNFTTYPYAQGNWDRWAPWYFPNTNWGLAGVSPDIAYPGGEAGSPNQDTSSWAGVGWGRGQSLDDTPAHVVSWWARYDFLDGPISGLQFGFGGQWESAREYASEFTTAGQKKQNETGTSIKAETDERLTLNAMVKYDFTIGDNIPVTIQLNVDNFLDDDDQYGLVYAPGRSWRLSTGIKF